METVNKFLRASAPPREPKTLAAARGAAAQFCSRGGAEARSFEGKS